MSDRCRHRSRAQGARTGEGAVISTIAKRLHLPAVEDAKAASRILKEGSNSKEDNHG